MQTHREKAVGRLQLIRTQCVLKFGLTAEAPLRFEAAVELPEWGSPAALIISFIYQGWFHTPVNIKLIISNKQVNKSHLQNGPPQMNLWVLYRIWGNYINVGACGGLNVLVLSHNCQEALGRRPLELWLAQVAILDSLFLFGNLSLTVYPNDVWAWVHTDIAFARVLSRDSLTWYLKYSFVAQWVFG